MPRSPRRRIRLASVIGGLRCIETRLGLCASADLAPATGARTTRFCRTQRPQPIRKSAMCCRPLFSQGVEAPFVCTRFDRSRKDPPYENQSRPTLPRPPHPVPTFVTMANAPLVGQDGGDKPVIWVRRKEGIFFKRGLDQANRLEAVGGKPLIPLRVLRRLDGKSGPAFVATCAGPVASAKDRSAHLATIIELSGTSSR